MKINPNATFPKNSLQHKTILVTGANRGLGRAITLDLAKAGATVVMLGRDLASLEQTYDDVVSRGYATPILYPLDLEGAQPQDYHALQQSLLAHENGLDGLIHNASILGTMMPIQQYDLKLWYTTLQINLHAVFMLTQALIAVLNQSPDGRILFVSDAVGRTPKAYWGAYGVSKAAIEGFSQILAQELERTNIRVNTFDPGKMRTELRRAAYPAENSDKLPRPDAISPAVVYLMSKTSQFIHGERLELQNKGVLAKIEVF